MTTRLEEMTDHELSYFAHKGRYAPVGSEAHRTGLKAEFILSGRLVKRLIAADSLLENDPIENEGTDHHASNG